MGNCLVTKLKGNVNNDNLEKLGELRVGITAVNGANQYTQKLTFGAKIDGDIHVKILDNENAYFTTATSGTDYTDGVGSIGQEITVGQNSTRDIYISNHNCTLSIDNKYRLTHLQGNVGGSLHELKYCSDLIALGYYVRETSILSDLEALVNLQVLQLSGSDNKKLTGSLSSLASMTALKNIDIHSHELITGNISVLNNMPDLIAIHLGGDLLIEGDASQFLTGYDNLTSLTLWATPGIVGKTAENKAALEAEGVTVSW